MGNRACKLRLTVLVELLRAEVGNDRREPSLPTERTDLGCSTRCDARRVAQICLRGE